MRISDRLKIERGSISLLGLALLLITLMAHVSIVNAASLNIAQKRLVSTAEVLALATLGRARDNFTAADDRLAEDLKSLASSEFLSLKNANLQPDTSLQRAGSPDGQTVVVELCAPWFPVLLGFQFGQSAVLCGSGSARAI